MKLSSIILYADNLKTPPFAFPHVPSFSKDVRITNGVARITFMPTDYYNADEDVRTICVRRDWELPKIYTLHDISIVYDYDQTITTGGTKP